MMSADESRPLPPPPPMPVAAAETPAAERRVVLRLVFDPQSEGEALLTTLLAHGVSIASTHTPESYYLVRARVAARQSHVVVALARGAALWSEVHFDEEVEALRVVFEAVTRMSSTRNEVTRTMLGPPAGIVDRAQHWGVARVRADEALGTLARAGWLTIEALAQGVRRVGLTPAGERMAGTWLAHPTASVPLQIGEMTWDLGRSANDIPELGVVPPAPVRYVERRGTEIWLGELMLRAYRETAPELALFDRILRLAEPIRHPADENLAELGGPIRGIGSKDEFRTYKNRLKSDLYQAAGCDIVDPRRGMIGLAPGVAPRPRRGPAPPTT